MLENLIHLAPSIVAAFEMVQKAQWKLNEDNINSLLASKKITMDQIKSDFSKLKNKAEAQLIHLTDEMLNKLNKEYDDRPQRYYLSFLGYNPSSKETNQTRENLRNSNNYERVIDILNYMENPANWKRGFCKILWEHLIQTKDLFIDTAVRKQENHQSLSRSCGF